MIKKIDYKQMGKANHGWLNTLFHFSFAQYFNRENMNFGVLRVLNDDLIKPHTGFDTHPHNNMEIISYVIEGELTHQDSMGNSSTISRGHVQYMSAGTGVYHSEHNHGDETLRLLQLWIFPDQKGYQPQYGDERFNWEDRLDKWLHIVSSMTGNAPIKIHQDVNIYVTQLSKDSSSTFTLEEGRQAYMVQIEGESVVNGVILNTRDALEIYEESITLTTKTGSHNIIIEMSKN